jgi:hypothetical protein
VQEPSAGAEAAKKLAAFRALTEEIHQLNLEEPLTPEFDAILSQRVNFTKELDL